MDIGVHGAEEGAPGARSVIHRNLHPQVRPILMDYSGPVGIDVHQGVFNGGVEAVMGRHKDTAQWTMPRPFDRCSTQITRVSARCFFALWGRRKRKT